MKAIKWLGLVFVLSVSVGACKTAGVDMEQKARVEGCKKACGEAETECVDKCSSEVDPDACKVACKAARDKCVKECT